MNFFKRFILFVAVFNCVCFFPQNETNNWYFGENAGLNFDNGDITVLNNGGMDTAAGCSSISDSNGELLFYTNGQTVWNKNHVIMENGEYLAGDIFGIQTSIIIPKPNDPTTYYIFVTNEFNISNPAIIPAGVFYSEVKFDSLHPLGYIIIKNERIAYSSTSRLTAIHQPDGISFRLICLTNVNPPPINTEDFVFRIFDITSNGINLDSEVRTINESIGTIGAMKISPDGEYVAVADRGNSKVFFYKYDNVTLNFNLYFVLPTVPAFGLFINPYGVEFSQDSKIFYYSGSDFVVQFQFLMIGGLNPVEYYLIPAPKAGSLQLSRNGKIYVSQGDFDNPLNRLGVINKPEKIGDDCVFQGAGIQFSNSNSTEGLPIFVESFLRNRIIVSDDDCLNTTFNFDLDAYTQIQSVEWDFGDGTSSFDFNPAHTFTTSGIHKVKATIVINNLPVTLFKDVEVYPLPFLNSNQVLSQCDVDFDGVSIFNLENIKDFLDDQNTNYEFYFYHNYNDAFNDNNSIQNYQFYENTSSSEEIFVKIINKYGCSAISSFLIENYQPNNSTIQNIYVCESSDGVLNNLEGKFNLGDKEDQIRSELNIDDSYSIEFYSDLIDAQTKMNPLDKYYTTISTIIWVRIEDDNHNCFGVIPFNAVVNTEIILDIEDEYTICDPSMQPNLILDGGISNDSWEWKFENGSIISTQRLFQPLIEGNYSIKVNKIENGINCSITKNFNVMYASIPEFDIIKADDGEIFVSLIGESSYEFSLDGINYYGSGTSHLFTYVMAGIYTIYVRDKFNCEKGINTEVYLIGIPKFFSPNGDGFNDNWRILGLSTRFYSKVQVLIFDRYGKVLYKMDYDENEIGWNGQYGNHEIPANDYWYIVSMTDVNNNVVIKRGHFSLKR